MEGEIIYVCNSTNNKNVRRGELEILRKFEDKLFFEFGDSEINIKKRFYNDLETLNKDFDALTELKNSEQVNEQVKDETLSKEDEKVQEALLEDLVEKKEEPKKNFRKFNKKSNLL